MESREFKDLIYGQFARISKALSSPKRFELLDYLSQGPKTVEKLSQETQMSVANTSKHLQSLLDARLVKFNKSKNFVYYYLADDKVAEVISSIRNLTEKQFLDISHWKKEYLERDETIRIVHLKDIFNEITDGEFVLIDVRPQEEFENKHIPGAISVPVQDLEEHLSLLPKNKKIIAYCRGPYCAFASQAVEKLSSLGYEAYRMEEGVNEWKQAEYLH
ncbi:metalloregulator ArsR/SmtB family transcription factor [Bacillus paramycoides]|uniref:ArsR/SmtB family transcription factor n=1 Tax=Bacillus paramycoides TaxID=2026194 RepID=UPI002E1FCE87|nr:metalloregulator ArsR/SmtB family transcription factor [Bacillus paramycoides]MED0965315.1 metalloregulator ArsR/SmtB family transcription factor [Bacillus paramycoides]MED0971595.1 metalloregulator ArsR/SmtB family transcription factor [Bacillus paramycoides]MED0986619.1 metalloregulator ArsR/SmtB family transcription factor [Bacillus paramycoides]MED1091858.1 metalloregulator ArsR/SmtB family transcription factor [Bacillus paramycoides]MED1103198.1 metalloregulator ArsR/SmtB family transc